MRNKKAGKLMLLSLTLAAAIAMTACGTNDTSADNANTGNASVENENTDNAATENAEAESNGPDIFKTMDTVDMNGEKVDSTVFAENTLTFVNLWNVGCTPCVQEIPILDQLNDEYEGKGVAIKGLYFSMGAGLTDDERKEINEILENAEADYQQITLSEDMINHEVIRDIQAFPTTFVVDSEGNIVNGYIGSNDYEGWKETIEKELERVSENTEAN